MRLIRGEKGGGSRNVGCRFKRFRSVEYTFIVGLKVVDLYDIFYMLAILGVDC